MGIVRLPQRFLAQPQYAPQLAEAYRDAEILSLFNDGAGRDLAKGNHLVPGVAPLPVVRQHGKALSFDGLNSKLDSTRIIPNAAQFTVLAWVRPATLNSGYSRILETYYVSQFYLGSNTGSKYAWIVNNSALEGCIGGQQVVGQRDFLVGVFDGASARLYVNGVQVGSIAATTPITANLLRAGYWSGGSGFAWNGDIDTVGVFNRAFPAAEVWSLYQNPWQLLKAPARRLWVVPSSGSTGTVAYTNANDTSAASGTTTVTGSSATMSASDMSTASGMTTIAGSLATTNVNDTCSANGESDSTITGDAACTNNNDLSAANGTTTVIGSLARTNDHDIAAASGVINDGIVVEAALTTGIAEAIRIKKPGIPAGAPEWLRTMLEIIVGRRGNKIEIPGFQTLTFSATPTKAECEALYAYANTIRDSLEQLINRMDS